MKTKTLPAALLLLWLLLLCAAPQLLRAQSDPNDTARILAGMAVAPGSPLAPLMRDASWQQHAQSFDSAWAKLDTRQISKIHAWSGEHLHPRSGNVFYMFSGPDFLYADAFFPGASNYVLCGIEPVGPIPDLARIHLAPALANIESSLKSVLNYSFFQTKEMRQDFGRGQLNGTLPILYVFLARSGKTIRSVEFVQPRGVRIAFEGGALYYFSVDLSNGSVEKSGLLSFCRKLGRGSGLLKSASYLPHQNNFSAIRNFLLDQCDLIVQDDAGIPLRYFDPAKWQVRLYGDYLGPIDIFKQFGQADLAAMPSAGPLPFGIGYRGWDPRKSALIVAERR